MAEIPTSDNPFDALKKDDDDLDVEKVVVDLGDSDNEAGDDTEVSAEDDQADHQAKLGEAVVQEVLASPTVKPIEAKTPAPKFNWADVSDEPDKQGEDEKKDDIKVSTAPTILQPIQAVPVKQTAETIPQTAIQQAFKTLTTNYWIVEVQNGIPISMKKFRPKETAPSCESKVLIDTLRFVSRGCWKLEVHNGFPMSVKKMAPPSA